MVIVDSKPKSFQNQFKKLKTKYIIILCIFILIIVLFGYIKKLNNNDGGKVSAPINQNFDVAAKLLSVGNAFDITLTISAKNDSFLRKNVIVSSLYDKIHSQYESPFDGNILNFEDNFELVSVSNGWNREKITSQSDYKIVKFLVEKSGQAEILEGGWLFINSLPSVETKTLTLSLKAKQRGRFGFVMSQMQSKTGFINLCVGDGTEEAQELCKERRPSSTRIESANDCNKNNFSMAFILVANTKTELTSERISKLSLIKNLFANTFRLATNGLASMDTSYPIFSISREDLTEYSVETISKKFYETNEDKFDFISIYAVSGASSTRQTSHEPAQNKINGIGIRLYDRTADFGSGGKLLGVNYERDIDILSGTGSLLHETGHQWCCFVGNNFNPDNTSLGVIQDLQHWFRGLESSYQCGTPMGSNYWVPNGDGTFRLNKDCLEPIKYHPFQLYFMGLSTKDNFDFNKKFTIYYSKLDMESRALPYSKVSINDILQGEGIRSCQKNQKDPSLPTGPTVQ